jgi:hypothetical protein
MKKISLIIILFASVYAVEAQMEMNIQNIVLSTPMIDMSKVDTFLHICGTIRNMEINCLDDKFVQKKNNIWQKQIKIQSEGAKEIKIVFEKFILSPNAIVSFYTDSLRYQYRGANFIHKPDSSYISNFIQGDNCIIIIEIPVNEIDKNQIIISQIYHFTESFDDAVMLAKADYSCMIDANCSEGNDWYDQKRSVAIYYFPLDNGFIGLCTGTLVNNYRNNFAQYFLTARHCTDDVINWNTTEFYFNYQNTFCNSNDRYIDDRYFEHYRVQGAQLMEYCNVSWSDNAILLITDPIPIQYNVYYAGVDITKRKAGDKVTCIHHSDGKPKKIVSGKLQHFAGPKWEMYWDNGIISGGGSGAPIFLNSNKRAIATVSGGFQNLDCSNNLKQEWVGKIRSCNAIEDFLFGASGGTSYSGIDPIKTCQPTLNLQGDFYSTHEYDANSDGLTIQAENEITVSSAIFNSGSNYTLTAGNSIQFLPGTEIKLGASVIAEIVPCGSTSSEPIMEAPYEEPEEPLVIMSELLYDTPLSESSGINRYNGEFVTIYNYGDNTVDVSGWSLVSDGSNQNFTFPQGSVMQPGAKFYVAYRNVNGNFSLSDLYLDFQLGENDREFYQRAIVHANSGESITLYRADGITQDSLYYDGTTGRQPRLEAANQDNIPGRNCFSLQRTKVKIINGVITFSRSDWANGIVALEQYPYLILTENGDIVQQ